MSAPIQDIKERARRARVAAMHMVACPYCGATREQPCLRVGTLRLAVRPHQGRMAAYRAKLGLPS